MTNIPSIRLMLYDVKTKSKEAIRFKTETNDHVNIFKYNGVTYIGLETEKIRYDRDKDRGVNYVENLINRGVYR